MINKKYEYLARFWKRWETTTVPLRFCNMFLGKILLALNLLYLCPAFYSVA